MFKNHLIKSYLVYSILAALLYSVTAYIFIRHETFNFSWILYLGNALFAVCIVVFIMLYNNRRKENARAETMITAGHITTIMGVVIACVITSLLFFLVPGIHTVVGQTDVLSNAPPQMESGKRHQFLLSLLMNAVIGNVAAGSFVSIVIPYAAKKDQKGGTSVKTPEEPEALNQK
jgi:hypothetical protein